MECRIGQVNVGRGKIAMEEMIRMCKQGKLDLVLVQEPYVRDGVISGCEGRWFYDRTGNGEVGSAVVVLNDRFDALLMVTETDGACVSLRIEDSGKSLNVVSLYCRPSEGIDRHLRKIVEIVRRRAGKEVVIGGDFNARSRLWWSDRTDRRGEKVEELLFTWDLEVLNQRSRWTTFENTQGGSSNIDVTVSSRDVARRAVRWEVKEETLSDHRLIVFEVRGRMQRVTGRNEMRIGSWNLREVDWRNFDRVLVEEAARVNWNDLGVNESAEELQALISRVMERTVPRSRKGQKKVPWWTEEIGEKRARLRRCRRRWLRTRLEEDRRMFVAARTSYVWEIRKEKKNAWQRLLDEEGESDPWGKAYKIIMDRAKKETVLVSLVKEDGSHTMTVEETLRRMIEGLLPDDNEEEDTEGQRRLRNEVVVDSVGADEPDFTEAELDSAVKQMKNRKAPGYEGVKVEIVKRMYGRIRGHLLEIYNKMLVEGMFPAVWKKGVVKVFLKSKDKDPSLVKSYRPVTLLPVLGKIGEKMVVGRMRRWLDEGDLLSDKQFGFCEGRGTVNALMKVRHDVEAAEEKYVLAVSLDISGAFDSAWWPEILSVLRNWNCPKNVYRVVRDYFSGRDVVLQVGNGEAGKRMTRGCPQGSVVGPLLWNVLFDSLLRMELGEGVSVTAYADDALLLVRGRSTGQLVERGSEAVRRVVEWGREKKLSFSRAKTVTTMLKGRLVRGPRLQVEGEFISCKREMKYLGVIVGTKMSFARHVEEMAEKVKNICGRLAGQAKANGGMTGKHLMKIYKGCVEPVMLYGSEFWGPELRKQEAKRRIMSVQRKVLLKVSKGYNTVSHEAVRVVTGAVPIDLLVRERMKIWEDREAGMDKEESKVNRREETMGEWQRRWEDSEKGRETFRYMPDVRKRMNEDWEMDHYLTQYLTGHGNFKANLRRFNLVEEDTCECGDLETASHVLMDCAVFEEERRELRELMARKNLRWNKEDFGHDEETRKALKETARVIGRRRERWRQ